ncbi:MAG: hypothetical protein R2780_01740 [Crocinitomicaceae bacterium]
MKKAFIILGVGGLLFMGGRYLWQLNQAGNKAVVEVSGRVHKVMLNGIVVVVNYNIKNPANVVIELATPLIKLSHNNKVIASSSMSIVDVPEDAKANGRIRIAPHSETGVIETSVLLPYLSLIGAGASLITKLKDRLNSGEEEKEPIEFEIETLSTVFTKIGSVPYDDKQVISF